MVRLVAYLLAIALIASGLAWLADRPGTLLMTWQGYDIETTVFQAAVILAITIATTVLLWSMARTVWNSPGIIGERIVSRRKKRGLDALSSGMIAIGAGDKVLAARYALMARKSLPHEPLTQLLRAQAAQLSGDRATARRIYEAMLGSPDTEQLGLRGLFLEAEREGAAEAAQQFAGRALKANPKLGWSADALFELQCRQKDWAGALDTLSHTKRIGHGDKAATDRKRAVLLTAKAVEAEDNETDMALTLALEAHALAPDLVPAAAVAGRILASRGNTAKAAKILQKTWIKSPHPDLATAYAYARIGDSTQDRLDRIRQLAALNPHSIESPIAIATTAIDARLFDEARQALQPLLNNRLTQRVATLMARIEAGDSGDKGRVREWLARGVAAARDPVWISDGIISDTWEPVSPMDGKLDTFQWRVPVEARDEARAEIIANRLEELLAIGSYSDRVATSAMDQSDDIIDAVTNTHPRAGGSTKSSYIEPETRLAAEGGTRQTTPTTKTSGNKSRSTAVTKSDPATAGRATPENVTIDRPQHPERSMAGGNSKDGTRQDAKLFVAPRSPDDPGPDAADEEALSKVPKRPYRAIN